MNFFISSVVSCFIYIFVGVSVFMTFGEEAGKYNVFRSYLDQTNTSPSVVLVSLNSSSKLSLFPFHLAA
jgi:amino acid permease